MCNPWNSSQIFKEHLDIAETDTGYTDVWKKTFGTFPINVMDDQQWFDHDIMWDQVISLIPNLKKVYMTGGEPTLIKNNFKFMKSCIEQGRKDIVLFFNTNCTIIINIFNKNLEDLD
jgi:organic radical activating enzyme